MELLMLMEHGGKMAAVPMPRTVPAMMESPNAYDCEYILFKSVNSSDRQMGLFFIALVDIPIKKSRQVIRWLCMVNHFPKIYTKLKEC